MSILIVALPRTGSSVLASALATSLSYKVVQEPFNPMLVKRSDVDMSDITPESEVVVKTMVEAYPKSPTFQAKHPNIFSLEEQNTHLKRGIAWNSYFLQRFKTVILLDRADTYNQCVSLTNAVMKSNLLNKADWHSEYRATILEDKVSTCIERLNNYKTNLEVVSINTGIPIQYYEEFYSEDVKIRLEQVKRIREHYSHFDEAKFISRTNPAFRYRKFNKPSTLL